MAVDQSFWTAEAEKVQLRLAAYQAAALAFAENGGMTQYQYNSGQTEIRVDRVAPAEMERVIWALYGRLQVLCRLAGLGDPPKYMGPEC